MTGKKCWYICYRFLWRGPCLIGWNLQGLVEAERHLVLFVTLVRRSERVGDRDDTHTWVREGAEGRFGEIECPSTTAPVGAPVHNLDGDRAPAAAVTLALDAVVAAAVASVVPYVGVTVARSREVLVAGELVWVIPIARRGYITTKQQFYHRYRRESRVSRLYT